NPCGRCGHVIEHDRRAHWNVVNRLVNQHWEACPGNPHGHPVRIPAVAPTPTPTHPPPPEAPTVQSALGNPSQLTTPSTSRSSSEPVGASQDGWMIASGWERKRRTEEQRKLQLEEDEYTSNVTPTTVVCVGCHKLISLDKRSRYYPGLWLKHKGKCPDVEKL
ncbi:hypothetical protein BU15DRAFT_10973, partial [Melanogaster broomeanus]